MPQADKRSPTSLFNDWKRRNDTDAGQELAQRVADWYYALATSFAGETKGAQLADQACNQFGTGVGRLDNEEDLIPWAHDIINREFQKLGGNAKGLNHPSL